PENDKQSSRSRIPPPSRSRILIRRRKSNRRTAKHRLHPPPRSTSRTERRIPHVRAFVIAQPTLQTGFSPCLHQWLRRRSSRHRMRQTSQQSKLRVQKQTL